MSIINVDKIGPVGSGNTVTVAAAKASFTGIVTASSFSGTVDSSNLSGALPAISGANLTAIPGANITGTIPEAALSNANLVGIRQDITKLALQIAVDTNRAAYNLTDSFIDQYENNSGIGTNTNAERNSSEYVGTYVVINDPDLAELWNFESKSGDATSNPVNGLKGLLQIKEAGNNGQQYTAVSGPFNGTKSLRAGDWDGQQKGWRIDQVSGQESNDPLNFAANSAFTVEGWVKMVNGSFPSGRHIYLFDFWASSSETKRFTMAPWKGGGNSSYNGSYVPAGGYDETAFSTTAWKHFAYVRDTTGNHAVLIDGARKAISSSADPEQMNYVGSDYLGVQERGGLGGAGTNSGYWYFDQFRISKVARYDPTQTTYTVPTADWTATTASINATGSIASTAQTASSSRTKVSGVLLYKNESGTATLGTDLKVYFTCNGGSNWTEVTSSNMTTGSDFSSGIKTVYLAETTCTAGTDIRYRLNWANQASGSKETRVYGMAINY